MLRALLPASGEGFAKAFGKASPLTERSVKARRAFVEWLRGIVEFLVLTFFAVRRIRSRRSRREFRGEFKSEFVSCRQA